MTEIKFPSVVGISLEGDLLVLDSKRRYRKLKNFNHKTGRKSYKNGEYDGPIVRRGSFVVNIDDVPSYGQWLQKRKKK